MKTNTILTAERLRELLHYEPDTGVFTWKVRRNPKKIGDVAGCLAKFKNRRRRVIGVDGTSYLAARLAWLYVTGEWPLCLIDHENLNSEDDRFSNLREANYAQNGWNQEISAKNTSGLKGVSFDKTNRKWLVVHVAYGKQKHIGRFTSREEAKAAWDKAATAHRGEFARL